MSRWSTRPLGELVDFVGGGTPARSRAEYWNGSIPWASVKDLQTQSIDSTIESITEEGLKNSAANLIPEGTVIIASRVGLGKVAINSIPIAINQDLKALTPRDRNLLPRFLLYFMLSKAVSLGRAGVGATVKGLTVADYQKLAVPVPPLAEQERIVKLLDEADALRKLRAEADRRTAELIPALFYEMFGDPEVRKQSRAMLLSEAYWFQEGPGVRKWQFRDSGIKLLNVANITENGQIDLARTERYLDKDEVQSKYSHFLVDAGDLVMPSSGISIDYDGMLRTRAAVVEPHHLPLCMNTSTIRFKAISEVSTLDYLLSWIDSDEFRVQITRLVTGSAQLNFGPSHLRTLQIILPDLHDQQRFSKKAEYVRITSLNQEASGHTTSQFFTTLLGRSFLDA